MALSKQLTVKRQRTGIPDSVKKRVILQDDDDQPVPARPLLEDQRRALAGQQSLVLSPPRHSTVVDKSVLAEARTDIASLKDKVPVGKEEVGRLVTVIGQHQHGTFMLNILSFPALAFSAQNTQSPAYHSITSINTLTLCLLSLPALVAECTNMSRLHFQSFE